MEARTINQTLIRGRREAAEAALSKDVSNLGSHEEALKMGVNLLRGEIKATKTTVITLKQIADSIMIIEIKGTFSRMIEEAVRVSISIKITGKSTIMKDLGLTMEDLLQ